MVIFSLLPSLARADGDNRWLRWEDTAAASLLIDRGGTQQPVGEALLLQPRVTYNYKPLESDDSPPQLWPYLQRRPSLTFGVDLLGGQTGEPPPQTSLTRPTQTRWLAGTSVEGYKPFGPFALLGGLGYLHESWLGPPGDVQRDEIDWSLGLENAWDDFAPRKPNERGRGTVHLRLTHHGFIRFQSGAVAKHVDGELRIEGVSLPRVYCGAALLVEAEWLSTNGPQTFWLIQTRGFLDLFIADNWDLFGQLAIAFDTIDTFRFGPSLGVRKWWGPRIGAQLLYIADLRPGGNAQNDREGYTVLFALTGRFR